MVRIKEAHLFSESTKEDPPFFAQGTRTGFELRVLSQTWQIWNETILPRHHTPWSTHRPRNQNTQIIRNQEETNEFRITDTGHRISSSSSK